MFQVLSRVAWYSLLPDGKKAKYYSTGISRVNRQMFLDDWATLFTLLEEGKIKPVIAGKYPISWKRES